MKNVKCGSQDLHVSALKTERDGYWACKLLHHFLFSPFFPTPHPFASFTPPLFYLPLVSLSPPFPLPPAPPSLATVHDIVTRGGRCLIPVFALGRAQELLLILGELNSVF